jgi:S-DNA-T family DNA segregation ATPase FtsK/SpoIIIE
MNTVLAGKGKRKALVIGVSDYQDENLENLDFCKNDVSVISELLRKNGYDLPENKILIGKVSYGVMKKAIISFFRDKDTNTDDTLLFYFSGHGVLDGYGGRFFANTQIDSQLPEDNGIPFSFLTEQMQKSHSFKKVAILDCCFSGDALAPLTGKSGSKGAEEAEKRGHEALRKEFEGSEGNCILASSLSNELSYKLPDKPFSAFSYYVIEGLKGAVGAYDEDFCVTPSKLNEYVFSQLKQRHGLVQKPISNLSVAGKIVLAEIERPKGERIIDVSDLLKRELEKHSATITALTKVCYPKISSSLILHDTPLLIAHQ